MRRLAAVAGGLALLLAAAGGALAWDTKEAGLGGDDKGKWIALYNCLGGVSRFGENCAANEHERLADIALAYALAGPTEWAIAGETDLTVVDLNASLYRPELRRRGSWPPGASREALETRGLADPPHFAGLADFSYSLADWVNKNAYCPPLPLDRQGDPRCHVYGVFHGAMFNSSHWAKQGELNYRRLHAAALREAARARALREAVEASRAAGDLRAHRDAIREAEFLAMAFEGYAQHFLQDRWAMGHMWNRWGAPDHVGYPYTNKISTGAMIGGMVGLIHGAEAVVHYPDAMSSPAPQFVATGGFSGGAFGVPTGASITGVNEMQWKFPGETNLYGGVGDYRIEALLGGRFGKDWLAFRYTDWALDVGDQRGWLMYCSAAGWGEVIRTMGPNRAGGYGLQRLRLSTAGARPMSSYCFKPLATNRSMRDGWGFKSSAEAASDVTSAPGSGSYDMLISVLLRLKMMHGAGEVRAGDGLEPVGDRVALARITNAIALYGRFFPDGTELADGSALPDWGAAKTSEQYPIASYFEPVDLRSLPERSEDGRDRQSLLGFFNRAHAGHFCRKALDKDLLETLRGSDKPEDQAACRYLAERIFAGTPDDYSGPQAESRRLGGAAGAPMTPLCELQPDAADRIKLAAYDRDIPYFIHPGYVGFDAVAGASRAYSPDPKGYSPLTVGHWCDRRPVLDTLDDPGKRDRDIVGELSSPDDPIVLRGENLGTEGDLRIGRTWSDSVRVEEVRRWRDDRIEFVLGDQADLIRFDGDGEAFVFINRRSPPGNRRQSATETRRPELSVGRFVIKKVLPRPKLAAIEVKADGRRVYSDREPAPGPEDVAPDAAAPAFTPPPPGAFRPIGPGQDVEVRLDFDIDMERGAEGETFQLGGQALEGEWTGPRRWVGRFRSPEGSEFIDGRRGYQAISINARARKGDWFDADDAAAGVQQATRHELLFDLPPLFVERVRVRAEGREIYDGLWRGGPDYDRAENWTRAVLAAASRTFALARAAEPPSEGEGEIRVELSADSPAPPTAQIGGTSVLLRGQGKVWTGRFRYELARQGVTGEEIPIAIRVTDGVDRNFDANPATPFALEARDKVYGRRWWSDYEETLAGGLSEVGGNDTRHKLGRPPEGSLVILIDRSGSMDGDRLVNAKAGVLRTLAGLPARRRIEVAVVAFDGCGSPQVSPFTQDRAATRAFVEALSTGGSTAIADAHRVAGELFKAQAHPASRSWRYVTFTDGAETCDGDVAAAMRDLEALIAGRQGRAPEPAAVQTATTPGLPDVNCQPASWRVWETRTEAARVLPRIQLVEHWYFERELPDGRCMVRLASSEYGVFYGESGGRRRHGVNSRPSREQVEFASSQNGRAGIDRVRRLAGEARSRSSDLAAARTRMAEAVGAALDSTAAAPAAVGAGFGVGGWVIWPVVALRRRKDR